MPQNDFVFSVTSFKADDGECLFVRCAADGECFNLLIDGGRGGLLGPIKRFLAALPENQRQIDVFLVTHIDDDHIVGAIEIIKDEYLNSLIKDVWFNSRELEFQKPVSELTIENGNALAKLLRGMGDRWNKYFKGRAIVWSSQAPAQISVLRGTTITVLGPSEADFEKLKACWPEPEEDRKEEETVLPPFITPMGEDILDVENLGKSVSEIDTSRFNRSSIAIHLQHRDKSVLLSSDSYALQLVEAMKRDIGWPINLALATIPHHGSRRNIDRAMADGVCATFWLISTNGRHHKHPHPESVARIIMGANERGDRPTLVFNHRHKQAEVWDDCRYKRDFNYQTRYRIETDDFITVNLS